MGGSCEVHGTKRGVYRTLVNITVNSVLSKIRHRYVVKEQ